MEILNKIILINLAIKIAQNYELQFCNQLLHII